MLSLFFPTMGAECSIECTASWAMAAAGQLDPFMLDNRKANRGVLGSMQLAYETSTTEVIGFLHDDVVCQEQGWDMRVLGEFKDESVGVVGFGGAVQLGADEIYKCPYKLQQLARFGYMSNTEDAEIHGTRFDGSRDVATLDGFALFFRKSLVAKFGGFPVDTWPPMHHYDHYLCLMARRYGYRVRVVGVKCHHLGGATTVKMPEYKAYIQGTKYGSDSKAHEDGHVLLYEEFRDLLPVRC